MLDLKNIKKLVIKSTIKKVNKIKTLINAGYSEAEIRNAISLVDELQFYRTPQGQLKLKEIFPSKELVKEEIETKENELKINIDKTNIETIEELIKVYNIDTNLWECTKFTKKNWMMGYKDKTQTAKTIALHSLSAEFKVIKESQTAKKILDHYTKAFKKLPKIDWSDVPAVKATNKYMLEIFIPDLHLGKLCWKEETGYTNYDSATAINCFKQAVKSFLASAPLSEVGTILFPVGNDFFNVDNHEQKTTAGTPQSEDSRWQNTFVKGVTLLKEVIQELSMLGCRVHVPFIAGNHDTQRLFYLGEVISAYFQGNENVKIDNSPKSRKYFKFGQTLIGFTHGDKEKIKDLSLLLANEQPENWGQTKFHEWHLGHLHTEADREFNGVMVRHFPSLCAADAWHASCGHVGNIRAAKSMLFDLDKGIISTNYFKP